MERKLIDDGWEFCLTELGTGIENIPEEKFKAVNLPHDWLIYDANDLYKNSTGWYRRVFELDKEDECSYEVYFEGIYMDSKIYLNGEPVGEWKYGYSSFGFDITDFLADGKNILMVRVDFQSPNSRWYSGAGIYRDVYLKKTGRIAFVTDSVYVSAKPAGGDNDKKYDKWSLKVSAEVKNNGKNALLSNAVDINDSISVKMLVPELGIELETDITSDAVEETGDSIMVVKFETTADKPILWSPEQPRLYSCILRMNNGEEETVSFGFRDFTYDCNHGMFVNGRHVKLNGVCEHHDFGALGAAFSKTAMRRKLEILRDMGVNAIRTAHNMPAPELLELTDEMGFLVMDEAFDMWESCKTDYDYGRFFKEWQAKDVRSWIRRDRNHPSIFMWSIGNEIYDTHRDEHGAEITRMLRDEVAELDPYENAVIGIGSNFMPWENAQKCADILKFAGYNYGEKYYDRHHEEHPDWHIFGSETASVVQSRGIYHFPLKQNVLADDDLQCSSLGNSSTSWGAKNPEFCINAERDREYSIGQFLWTGFDYIGEPTPYHTRNSYFGQVDTAGFPKDTYYIYKAGWTDYREKPFVHVFPYWDFNPGQLIDVRVASNAPVVELLVNGRSLGKQKTAGENRDRYTGDWVVPYEKGEIIGIAYDEYGAEIARESRHSFADPVRLVMKECTVSRELTAGIRDYAFIEVTAVDGDGYEVSNANNRVSVTVTGAGWLAGLDNGDSADKDQYKGSCKRLFSGKMLICIAVGSKKGEITVTAKAEGLEGAECRLKVENEVCREGVSLIPEKFAAESAGALNIRKIELSCEVSELNKDIDTAEIRPVIYTGTGERADRGLEKYKLKWKAVNDSGIDSPIAQLTVTDSGSAVVRACGDGDFHVRCEAVDDNEVALIISQLDFCVSGLGEAGISAYRYIAGGLWNYAEGELGSGNEHGVATPRGERAVVGFDKIDFGSFGSDEITIDLFVLSNDSFPFQIWQGIPGEEGSELLANAVYRKEMKWNTYQPESYRLSKRVKGIQRICFVTEDKAHIGGFSFKKYEKAYELLEASECDRVYGDAFSVEGTSINGIGNNVTVEFYDMDFGGEGADAIEISGATPNSINTVHVMFERGGELVREVAEFAGDGGKIQRFPVRDFIGAGTVRLVFLPGSDFNLDSIRFIKRG